MKVEEINEKNIRALTHLMLELWPECDYEEEFDNCKRIIESENETCFLIKNNKEYIAFIQLSLRFEYVEGATSYPVVYIEGIYVKPEFRATGIGKRLVKKGEHWGKIFGCKHLASDAELHNNDSILFHKKMGFKEVNRAVLFIKNITASNN